MGILSKKESCLVCDEKYHDIWFEAVDREDAVPSSDPYWCLAYCCVKQDELGDTNTFGKMLVKL